MVKNFKDFNIKLKGTEPDWIIDQLCSVKVNYIDFDGHLKVGEIICNKGIKSSLIQIFSELIKIKFPIFSVIPISEFGWDDDNSCLSNNSSCFNYREVKGTNKLSDHSIGMAIDINPMQNPWENKKYGNLPKGSFYDISKKGTITEEIVSIFLSHGFSWGGNWNNKDYQHFYKKI